MNLSNASIGDVYNIRSGGPIVDEAQQDMSGKDFVCITKIDNKVITPADYNEYWEELNSHIDLSGYVKRSGDRMHGTLEWIVSSM
jgi:hypothetical protein